MTAIVIVAVTVTVIVSVIVTMFHPKAILSDLSLISEKVELYYH